MSEILRRLSGRTGHSARSGKGPGASSNGAEVLPQLRRRSDRAPSRKPGIGKRLILISAGIVCVSFIARIVYYLVGEEPPTTDKAFVEGNTYLVSSNHH
jgi:hypothetical protein